MGELKDIRPNRITVELQGRRYSLVFDLNAFANLEDEYGTMVEAMEQMQKGSVKAIRALLWAGIQSGLKEGETLTIKQVGALVDINNMETVAKAITDALEVALPPESKVGAVDPLLGSVQ